MEGDLGGADLGGGGDDFSELDDSSDFEAFEEETPTEGGDSAPSDVEFVEPKTE